MPGLATRESLTSAKVVCYVFVLMQFSPGMSRFDRANKQDQWQLVRRMRVVECRRSCDGCNRKGARCQFTSVGEVGSVTSRSTAGECSEFSKKHARERKPSKPRA